MQDRTPPHSNTDSSPDDASPVPYPDRPIRPLPKRRLRSRLSEEEAKALIYPPAPTVTPLFNLNFTGQGKTNGRPPTFRSGSRGEQDEHQCKCGDDHDVGGDAHSVDKEIASRAGPRRAGPVGDAIAGAQQDHRAWEQTIGGGGGGDIDPPPAPGSTTSSADGYESFENTSNKKKRKIPLTGSGVHQSSLNADMVNMRISAGAADGAEDGGASGGGNHSPSPHASGTGISGAGRGRFGRPKYGVDRRPLGASTNGLNTSAKGATAASNGKQDCATEDKGIISAAIATAQELAQGVPPLDGRENVSLKEASSKRVAPQTSNFNFTLMSESRKRPQASNFTFSMESESSKALHSAFVPPPAAPQQYQQQPAPAQPTEAAQPAKQPRPRKPISRLYQIAARQRRLQQEYSNFHHPLGREEMWICEFCEYEAIFGKEPTALIRQYEEKDRKERKRAAEKKRLLEKAKMKGRKGRKGGKSKGRRDAAATTDNGANTAAGAQQQQHRAADNGLLGQEDDLYDDDLDDEPIASGGPPPPPAPTPTKELQPESRAGVGNRPGGGGGGQTTQTKPPGRTRRA